MVELTLSLHRSFYSPKDVILWDTGHQSYIHKMVTGRAPCFDTLRTRGGLSGYPSRAESPHDWVENSHAGTALSYAAGFRRGFDRLGVQDRHIVAVVGDGAVATGMAMEALNDIIDCGMRVIVVLNDNGRSYAPTTGVLAKRFAALRRGEPGAARQVAELDLTYLGPVDGHDLVALDAVFERAKKAEGPTVVHVVTVKGLGYGPAERDQVDHLHGVGPFDPETGLSTPMSTSRIAAGPVVNRILTSVARERDDVIVLVAAMGSASGLDGYRDEFPDRFFDVGIAEQHAVTCAAGMAMSGARPIVAIHATFMNRAFDQLLLDVGLHNLPVVFLCDRAGITGGDGPSHHGMFDMALMRVVPGLRIATPASASELEALVRDALKYPGPTMIRYCRSFRANDLEVAQTDPIDRWQVATAPGGVAVLAAGDLLELGHEVAAGLRAHGIPAATSNARWVVPLDPRLSRIAAEHPIVVTIEDHDQVGGLGTAVLEEIGHYTGTQVVRVGIPHAFLPHGDPGVLRNEVGLHAPVVVTKVRRAWAARISTDPVVLADGLKSAVEF